MVILAALSEPPLPARWEVICGDPLCRFRHSICLLSGENGENEGIGSLHCTEELPELFECGGRASTSSSTYNKLIEDDEVSYGVCILRSSGTLTT